MALCEFAFVFHWSQVHQEKQNEKQTSTSKLIKVVQTGPQMSPAQAQLKKELSPESNLKPPSGFVDKYTFP